MKSFSMKCSDPNDIDQPQNISSMNCHKLLLMVSFVLLNCAMTKAQEAEVDRCEDASTYYSLEEALSEPDEAIKLDIAMLKLTTISPDIAKLKNLECLDLSFNRITTLPPEFKQLEKLRVLDLKGTRFLQKLPQVVAELHSLELVDLRNHPEWKADQFDNAIKLLPGIKVLVD